MGNPKGPTPIQKEMMLLDQQIKDQTKRLDSISAKRGTIMGLFTSKRDQEAKDQLAEQIANLKDTRRRIEKFQNLNDDLNLGIPIDFMK